eukprot:EG_transcript_9481
MQVSVLLFLTSLPFMDSLPLSKATSTTAVRTPALPVLVRRPGAPRAAAPMASSTSGLAASQAWGATSSSSPPWWAALLIPAVVLVVVYRVARGPRGQGYAMAAFAGDHHPATHQTQRPFAQTVYRRPRLAPLCLAGEGVGAAVEWRPRALVQPKTVVGGNLWATMNEYPQEFRQNFQFEVRRLAQDPSKAPSPGDGKPLLNLLKGPDRQQALEDVLYFHVLHGFMEVRLRPVAPEQLAGKAKFESADMKGLLSLMSEEEQAVAIKHAAGAELATVLAELATAEDVEITAETKVRPFKYQAFEVFRSAITFGYFMRRIANLLKKASSDVRSTTLTEYFDEFSGSVMVEFARAAPIESSRVVQDYLFALFGDVPQLLAHLDEMDAVEVEGLERIQITVGDVKRMVLKAVAFGACLQNAEVAIAEVAGRPLLTRLF